MAALVLHNIISLVKVVNGECFCGVQHTGLGSNNMSVYSLGLGEAEQDDPVIQVD